MCFFATDIHGATLGKGKSDNSLERVRNGDMTGKGELVVGNMIQGLTKVTHVRLVAEDDLWQTSKREFF